MQATHDVTWSKSEYDVRDMINKIANADSPTAGNQQITTFTYTDRGQPLKQTKPNGNTVDYAYWLNGAVKSQVEKKSTGGPGAFEADGRGMGRADQAGQWVGAEPEQGQDPLRCVGDPFADRRDRGGAGQNSGGRSGEQGRPRVTDAATGPWVRNHGQISPQVSGCLRQSWAGGVPQLPKA